MLCKEIQNYTLTGKDSKLKALLSYICSDILIMENKKNRYPYHKSRTYYRRVFSKKYSLNVTLDDLAKELMLSHKQTEREVRRITGNTFAKELVKRKINAAIMLSQTTNLSLAEISVLVGYSSYCGFYKAYKKTFNCSPKENKDI